MSDPEKWPSRGQTFLWTAIWFLLPKWLRTILGILFLFCIVIPVFFAALMEGTLLDIGIFFATMIWDILKAIWMVAMLPFALIFGKPL